MNPLPLYRLLALVGCLGFAAISLAADSTATVSPEPFFRHPDYGSMGISPSGKTYCSMNDPFRLSGRTTTFSPIA